jgi:hypothetical protein
LTVGFQIRLDPGTLTIREEIIKRIQGSRTFELHKTAVSFEADLRSVNAIQRSQGKEPLILASHSCSKTMEIFRLKGQEPDNPMRSRIIGTEGRNHSSSTKGYRSDGLHNLRKEDRASRSLQPVRNQSPKPDRRTSTAAQRSQAIPSTFPDRIRGSQHRAQHWNQRGRFGFHDGNRTASNPSCLGEHDPIQKKLTPPAMLIKEPTTKAKSWRAQPFT